MTVSTQILDVWGEFACFTRPELKVERFSYPVITPSAARGIFDAILSKPKEFRWQVLRVEVLAQPSYIALRRNEVKDKASVQAIRGWMAGKSEPEPLWADGDRDSLGTDMKGRTQRQTMALRDVRYRLHAQIRPWPGLLQLQKSLEEQFGRRVSHGKCFYQPYLGCREFPAYFAHPCPEDPPPVAWDQDVGLMLYDVFDLSRPGTSGDSPCVTLFHAEVKAGVLDVPEYVSDRVLRVTSGR